MIRCQNCGAETSNGLALCELCRYKVTTDLEFIPVYFRNLARWRPGRAGSRPVPGSREPAGVGVGLQGDRVGSALDEAGNDLVGLARRLEDDRGVPQPEADGEVSQAAAVCRLLNEHLTSISTTDWAGDLVVTVARIESRLRDLTEAVVPGWYAGGCQQPVAFDEDGAVVRCDSGTYVIPGLTWVQCSACGARTYARDHLETVLNEARGWVARPMRIAEAVVALVDTEQSTMRLHDRIRQWSVRGRIETIRKRDADGDEVGPKQYRLGDVLDLICVEGETRTSTERKTA